MKYKHEYTQWAVTKYKKNGVPPADQTTLFTNYDDVLNYCDMIDEEYMVQIKERKVKETGWYPKTLKD